MPKHFQYGVFIKVDKKSELQPLMDMLDALMLERAGTGQYTHPYRVPMKLSNYRLIQGELD